MGKNRKICEGNPKERFASFNRVRKTCCKRQASTTQLEFNLRRARLRLFSAEAPKNPQPSRESPILQKTSTPRGCPLPLNCVQKRSCDVMLNGKVPQPA
jgi:hypothetical protein